MADEKLNGVPAPVPFGLHFLKALGHAALAYGHIAFNEEPDESEGEEEQPRRLKRPSGRRNSSRKKSCCIARR